MADFNIPQLRNRRLSSLLADPSVMDNYQPTQPLSGLLDYSDPAVKAGPDAIGPPTIAGGLLSLDPTDYVGPQTLGKLAAGLKGLLAGGMVMGGIKSVGKAAPYAAAHETARKNAVKMLGLPENNTAMDRAAAMGFDMPAAHFSRHGVDVAELDSGKFAIAPFDAVGTHVGSESQVLDRFNNTVGYKVGNPNYANDELKGVTYPLMVRRGNQMTAQDGSVMSESPLSMKFSESADYGNLRSSNEKLRNDIFSKFDSIPYINEVESPGSISYIVPSNNLRSRFAAFDPARRHEADLLGRATPEMLGATTLGGLLGLEAMRRNQE